MKYAAYSEYKPSVNAWADRVPQHWETASLRWLSNRYAGGTPDKGNDAFWEDGAIPWLNSGSVNDGYITQPSELITREGFAGSSAKWIPKGALVMALAGQGKTKGMVAQLGIEATCNQSMAAIIPEHRIDPRYLYWWLAANYQNIRNLAGGEARDGLNLEMLGSIPCLIPEDDEQQSIACFLDAKTAQIDELINKKRQLIEKLKEKRQALIARTVTRGLPPEAAKAAGLEPNPEMKNANQLWLGKVPSHWGVMPLKFVAKIKTGFAFSSDEFIDEGIPVVRIGDISSDGEIDLSDAKHLPVEYEGSHTAVKVRNNDILMAMTGATIGKAAIYKLDRSALLNQRVCAFRALPTFHQGYLWFILNSDFYIRYVLLIAFGGAQPNISDKQLLDCCVPVPPPREMVEISKFLEAGTSKFDNLMSQANEAIDRLAEYRQALITSAVTGKIDVRGVA